MKLVMDSSEKMSKKRKLKRNSESAKKKIKIQSSDEIAHNNVEDLLDHVDEQDNNTEMNHGDSDVRADYVEHEIKFPKDFNVLTFREKLRGTNFITELRHFLHLAKKNDKFVTKYINKRGKPLELVESLERIDKTHLYNVSYVCEAFQLVLMQILVDKKEHFINAINASRYFLKSHGQVVEKLLKSPSLSHRKVILKLLTAIVCLEPELGRQLLNCFDFLYSTSTIAKLLSHSEDEKIEGDTVRKAFIHFILSYLIDGNIVLIRNILDKRNLLKVLISGLLYDDNVTVCVVLNTIKKYVVENLDVLKTKKVNLFDFESTKNLMKLYDWMGPKVYLKNKKFNADTQQDEEDINSKAAIREAVHELLVILLTSRKYGLAFDSMTNFKQKRNTLQKKLMVVLTLPWLDNLKTELIVKVVKACPDIARSVIKHYGILLNPAKTSRIYWLKIASFTTELISACNASILRKILDKITLGEYTFWIKDICLSAEILVHLKSNKILLSEDFETRLATSKLLLVMFKQFCNYMTAILSREKYKGNDMRRFKLDLINYISVNFPTMENILRSTFATTVSINFNNKTQIEHFDVTLDLVLLVATHHRTFFNETGLVIDYMKVLDPLFSSEELGTKNIKLELKAIKTMLLLTPLKLSPNQNLFEKVLNCFINVFVSGEKDTQDEAGNLLRNIFLTTEFFSESSLLEIDIWLQSLKFFDATNVELIAFIFYACFQTPSKEVEEELKGISGNCSKINRKIEKDINLKDLFKKIENDETVEGYVETLTLSKLLPYINVKVEGDEKVVEYLDLVSLLLFHYLPVPKTVYEIYSFNSNNEYNKTYMKNLLKKNKIEMIPHMDAIPYYNKVHHAVLNGNSNFFEIFEDSIQNGKIRFSEDNKEFILVETLENERLLLIYIYLTIFITIHLTEAGRFEQKHVKASHQFLKFFLKTLHILGNTQGIPFKGPIFGEQGLLPKTDIPYLKVILKYIYCNHIKLLQNFNIFNEVESKQNFLKFLCELTNFVVELVPDGVEEFLILFQQKIVHQIGIEVKKTLKSKSNPKSISIGKILESFRISNGQCAEILKYLCQLNYKDFLDKNEPHNKSIYFEILTFVLNRSAELKQSLSDKDVCEKLSNIHIDLISNNENLEINLDRLEESLHNFLIVSHQCIEMLPKKLFAQFFEHKKITKSLIKLATLLLERNSNFQTLFLDNIKQNLSKKEMIYPLLKVLITENNNYKFGEKMLKDIYQEFKNGFMKTIEKPQKAGVIYKENVEVSIYLVNEAMPLNECVDFATKMIKTDTVEIYQVILINTIFNKAIQSSDVNSDIYKDIFMNYLSNCIQLYNIMFKRDNFEVQKIDYLNYVTYNWVESYLNKKEQKNTKAFNAIIESQYWTTFYKSCLKYGMQETGEISIDKRNSNCLKILAYFCSFIFKANDCENDETNQIYETILSNSKFSDIVLNNKLNPIKTQIFNLLLTLAQKNKKILNEKHIPIFLGAYQAKLSNCDRYILALIQFYECNGINLYRFRPFIWGEIAVTHYSLTKIEGATLEQQEPSIDQVMSLIDRFVSDFTVENFPVWRKLDTLKQLPENEFQNPENLVSNFGTNIIEKQIESKFFTNVQANVESNKNMGNTKKIDDSLLKLCLKREKIYEDCYDPAFVVPLICMCFASEMQSQPVRPVQNGLLSIVFAAMSSQDKEMRLAAGCCQLRYREHIESKKFFDQPLWIQTYDNIQNGLNQLQINWTKHKRRGIPKVPYISGLFLARAVNLLIQPADPLYKTIVMYLRLKESFDFLCVPEFNVLFHNSEINHTIFQQFILQIINDGIKSSSDLLILLSNNIFKAIMGFYFSVMTNLDLNLQILSIISVCAKIPASSKLLIDFVGILPWLNGVIEEIEYYKFDTIEAVISIINNLWFSIKIREEDFYNFKYLETTIFKLLVKLCPHISSRISLNNFARYLNILQKAAGENHKVLKEENLDRLLLCAQKHFETDVWRISNIKLHGPAGAESKVCFLKRLKNDVSINEYGQLALLNLREFVLNWCQKESL